MDYEKILKGIMQIINTTEKSDIGFVNICTYIGENCPELNDSKDERIRKAQLDYWCSVGGKEWHGVPVQEAIAWLEKQAPKPQRIISAEAKEALYDKPKWTDEDDTIRCEIIRRMEALDHYWNRPNDQKLIDWLKSLKQRMEQ